MDITNEASGGVQSLVLQKVLILNIFIQIRDTSATYRHQTNPTYLKIFTADFRNRMNVLKVIFNGDFA